MIDWIFNLAGLFLDKASSEIRSSAAAGLYAFGEHVMTEAKERCPVDTGNLRATGHVQPPVISGNEISVMLAFGGPAARYAIPVHENLSAQHPVGEAKFLERAVMENAAGMASFVGRIVAARAR